MEAFEFLSELKWEPFKQFGLTHFFFNIDASTVIYSWLIIAIILSVSICVRYSIYRKKGLLFESAILFVKSFQDMTIQTLGAFSLQHFSFVTALFIYIVLCNSIALIPGTQEPTGNINTTLALGLISFFYVQYYTIKTHGFWNYMKEYFQPIFIMFPLHVVGKLSSIISMSFRLFGNIFGGSTIATIYFNLLYGSPLYESIGLLSGTNLIILLFFGLFEGVIQAFVFAMLTITYLSIAISNHPEENT